MSRDPEDREDSPSMNLDRKPKWLTLKRLQTFNPLAAVRPMLAPMAEGERPAAEGFPDPGGV